MTESANIKMDRAIDRALTALSREVREATPRPGPDLVARVLADAAAVSHAARPAQVQGQATRRAELARVLVWVRAAMFGWASGAVAAMAVALVIGISVGLEMEKADLPLLASADEGMLGMADGALIPEEIL